MYLFFDTETTGLEDDAKIAQFAAILADEQRRVVGEFKAMVKPDGWTMPDETAKIHGCTQDRLLKYGISIQGVIALFNRWCSMSEVLVAHNIPYDTGRVRYAAQHNQLQLAMPSTLACTQRKSCDIVKLPPTEKMIAKGMGDKFKPPKLIEAYEFFFGEKFDGAHDALADVRACMRIYFELLDRAAQPEAA